MMAGLSSKENWESKIPISSSVNVSNVSVSSSSTAEPFGVVKMPPKVVRCSVMHVTRCASLLTTVVTPVVLQRLASSSQNLQTATREQAGSMNPAGHAQRPSTHSPLPLQ